MQSSTKIVSLFDSMYRSVTDKKYQDIRVSEKISTLNTAKNLFYNHISSNRDNGERFKRWLEPLEVIDESLKIVKIDARKAWCEKPKDIYNISSVEVEAQKGACVDRFDVHPLMNKNIIGAAKSYWKGNFLFRQAYRQEDEKYIYVYHDGDFETKKVFVSYLKNCPDMHAPGLTTTKSYEYSDGKVYTKDVGLYLGEGSEIPIVRVAIALLRDDGSDLQLDAAKLNLIINSII